VYHSSFDAIHKLAIRTCRNCVSTITLKSSKSTSGLDIDMLNLSSYNVNRNVLRSNPWPTVLNGVSTLNLFQFPQRVNLSILKPTFWLPPSCFLAKRYGRFSHQWHRWKARTRKCGYRHLNRVPIWLDRRDIWRLPVTSFLLCKPRSYGRYVFFVFLSHQFFPIWKINFAMKFRG